MNNTYYGNWTRKEVEQLVRTVGNNDWTFWKTEDRYEYLGKNIVNYSAYHPTFRNLGSRIKGDSFNIFILSLSMQQR